MANAVYPIYKQNLLAGTSGYDLDNDTTTDGPYVALIDTGTYTYSAAHDFYNDLSGVVGTDQRITTPTVTTGTFDGANVTFTAVSGATVEGFVVYRHNSGANTTWPLVLYYDQSGGGLPVTPNGGDITITWNASGIFTISDRDAKHDICQVGRHGPLPVYEYRYNGSARRQRGFLAQDVAAVFPQAVADFGRFKAVDYGRVLELAA
jgi:hypothetical protein